MKLAETRRLGRYGAVLLLALLGTAAILLILRAGTIADTSIDEAKRSDDIEYQLRLLKEAEVMKTKPAPTQSGR